MTDLYHQRHWTEDELRDAGFKRYERKRQLVLARRLPAEEAPMTIHTSWGDELVAQAGYYICYAPHDDGYEKWPVEPTIFEKTYRQWDDLEWSPDEQQQTLLDKGCHPYYKVTGIWAKKLDEDSYIQSMEHNKPVLVQEGRIVAIGVEGEPYHMGDSTLHDRYRMAENENGNADRASGITGLLKRLVGFFAD